MTALELPPVCSSCGVRLQGAGGRRRRADAKTCGDACRQRLRRERNGDERRKQLREADALEQRAASLRDQIAQLHAERQRCLDRARFLRVDAQQVPMLDESAP
jgi:hypothetical protein